MRRLSELSRTSAACAPSISSTRR